MRKKQHQVVKAYHNIDFLNSPDARVIRLISEFLEPARRFRHEGIRDTIVFFGSARVLPHAKAVQQLRNARKNVPKGKALSRKSKSIIEGAEIDLEMSRYYEDAVTLAKLLTKWTMKLKQKNRFMISSGGGPGIMEAANKGAKLAGGRSVGLNISLPHEQGSNPYIPDELNFEFHYFFMRKLWFVYLSKAMVMFPGGFGTFDETFEVLTLVQTRKLKKKVTVILYGREYWQRTLNFDNLVRLRLVSPDDLKLFHFADTPEEALGILLKEIRKNYPGETSEQM